MIVESSVFLPVCVHDRCGVLGELLWECGCILLDIFSFASQWSTFSIISSHILANVASLFPARQHIHHLTSDIFSFDSIFGVKLQLEKCVLLVTANDSLSQSYIGATSLEISENRIVSISFSNAGWWIIPGCDLSQVGVRWTIYTILGHLDVSDPIPWPHHLLVSSSSTTFLLPLGQVLIKSNCWCLQHCSRPTYSVHSHLGEWFQYTCGLHDTLSNQETTKNICYRKCKQGALTSSSKTHLLARHGEPLSGAAFWQVFFVVALLVNLSHYFSFLCRSTEEIVNNPFCFNLISIFL